MIVLPSSVCLVSVLLYLISDIWFGEGEVYRVSIYFTAQNIGDIYMMSAFIHLAHIVVIGGLFLYVGMNRNAIPLWLYPILLGTGVVIWFYHVYKAYLKYAADKNPWVNLIHIVYVAPILIYIGYNRNETPRYIYEILLMLGFATIGYHGLYVVSPSS